MVRYFDGLMNADKGFTKQKKSKWQSDGKHGCLTIYQTAPLVEAESGFRAAAGQFLRTIGQLVACKRRAPADRLSEVARFFPHFYD